MESRREPRGKLELVVSAMGRDKMGESFIQDAIASSVSTGGALLSGIGRELRTADLMWVEHAGRKARFKIVWMRNSHSLQLTQAAVQLLEREKSPAKGTI